MCFFCDFFVAPMSSTEPPKTDPLIESQLKYCSTIITKLKRKPNAGPFLRPVDPVLLNIPDYPEKIKHPMDISTIKHKLDTHVYTSHVDFNSDIELMFNNCFAYNPPDTPVHIMGKDLFDFYKTLYASLPTAQVGKRNEPSQPAFQEKTKRTSKSSSFTSEDITKCTEILDELTGPKSANFAFLFLAPVQASEVPDYHEIIKNPMDLETMRKKLNESTYSSFDDFVSDLRLIISNCLLYNAPESTAYKCGKELEKAVDRLVSSGQDIQSQISELRKKISAYTSELHSLERKINTKHVFSSIERERIGSKIIDLGGTDVEKVAEIVQRHGVYEYIDNDEIEINLQTMPDNVIAELDEYLRRLKASGVHSASGFSED